MLRATHAGATADLICSNCGTENRRGRRFCVHCASPLAAACANCGSTYDAGDAFCGECAAPLGMGAGVAANAAVPVRSGAPAAVPIAERRLVTVLFADLVGFTPFAEERDAEDVRDTLTRYFDVASDVVGRYGGVIEKFIGDAIMAVWGAPTAREDDAERAVRAALDLVDAVRVLGSTIQARAGVLTGEAAVTLGATNQGMVAGDLVNTAARLQSVAQPGTVLVGEPTMRAADKAIAFEDAGEHLLKGKTVPVPAYRALWVVAQRRGGGRSDLPEPPFVGRDEELRALKDLVSTTGRDPRARLVSVIGTGGIGKSRLAWELEKYIDGVVETIYWHRGRSPAYGEGISFWALGEMIRRRAGLAESDDEATTRERVAATTAEFVSDPEDRRWVEPALLTLLGLEPAPAGGRDVLFAAWRIFFERIAAKGTTVLLFEDLQWSDTGLLDFIDHLLEWSKGVPILIVTLARPELFDRRPDWGAGTRNFSAMALEPLPEAAMRELLAGFVPGLPASAVDAILARADGIPLYAVETVRGLLAEGRLELVDGTYRPSGDLTRLAIPDTLRSLIASRLDTLEPTDRELIADAAVLGQTFTVDSLASVSGREETELQPRLRGLVRRELLEVDADPRSPERGRYGFVQSLIREVAYGTLARRERRARHLAAARYYEALGDDELAGALANHYLSAYEASAEGAESEAIAIQARLALSGAAERAATLGAHEQAVAYLRQALAVTLEPAEQAPLLERAAVSAVTASLSDVAEGFARRALDAYLGSDDEAAIGEASALLGAVLTDAAKTTEAIEVLEGGLARLPPSAPDRVRAHLLSDLSRALMRGAFAERAIEVADQALPLAEREGLEQVIADTFNNKGGALGYVGRAREAVALMHAAVELAERGGFVVAEMRARTNLTFLLFSREPVRSREIGWDTLARARRVGNRSNANWVAGHCILASFDIGDQWDEALATADEVLSSAMSPAEEARVRGTSFAIRAARGDPVDAEITRLESLARQVSDRYVASQVGYVKGLHALLLGDYTSAYDQMLAATEFAPMAPLCLPWAARAAVGGADVERARHVARRLDSEADPSSSQHRADRLTAWAGVCALDGRVGEAIAGYTDAMRRYAEIGVGFTRACVALDAVRLLGTDDPEIARAAEEARALFERLGAGPYLAKLEHALGRAEPVPTTAVAG